MATYRILRHFRGAGRFRNPGELIDGAELANVPALVEQRYIALDTPDALPSAGQAGPTPDPKIVTEQAGREAAGLGEHVDDDIDDDETSDEQPKRLRGKLPEDFPGYKALVDAGLDTYAKVRKALDTLTEVKGIGEATADKIREEFAGESVEQFDMTQKLPEDFPGAAALSAAGVNTFADVEARMKQGDLKTIDGLDADTVKAI